MAVAVVTRHSPSRCLREIGPYAVILGERQQQVGLNWLGGQFDFAACLSVTSPRNRPGMDV
jgi:hypothetical protein